jgi:hypothetical protein
MEGISYWFVVLIATFVVSLLTGRFFKSSNPNLTMALLALAAVFSSMGFLLTCVPAVDGLEATLAHDPELRKAIILFWIFIVGMFLGSATNAVPDENAPGNDE